MDESERRANYAPQRGGREVGRPKNPMVIKRYALEMALAMIDADGLNQFSVRRLAHALGVTGPSLFHHFSTKANLLDEVARLAVSDVWWVEGMNHSGVDWIRESAAQLRLALMQHPEIVPLVSSQHGGGIAESILGKWYDRLASEEGIALPAIMPILESVLSLSIGSAHLGGGELGRAGMERIVAESSQLQSAEENRLLGSHRTFDLVVQHVIASLRHEVGSPGGLKTWSKLVESRRGINVRTARA